MLSVRMIVEGEMVIVMGTVPTIKKKAADRLGCSVDSIIFKVREDGMLIEFADTRSAWEHFANKNAKVYAFFRQKGSKGKSVSVVGSDLDIDKGPSTSIRTPPRPKQSQRIRGEETAAQAGPSRINASRRADNIRKGKRWTPKEDKVLWAKVSNLLQAMPEPKPVYTAQQIEDLFAKVQSQSPFGGRTVLALRERVRSRVKDAIRRKQPCPPRFQALFPFMHYLSGRGTNSLSGHDLSSEDSVEDEEGEEEEMDVERDKSPDSSSLSKATPPPPTRSRSSLSNGARQAPYIRPHNPFASIAAVPPRRPVQYRSSVSTDAISAGGVLPPKVTSAAPSSSATPASPNTLPRQDIRASATDLQAESVPRVPVGSTSDGNSVTGNASNEAIVIKDEESEDELMDVDDEAPPSKDVALVDASSSAVQEQVQQQGDISDEHEAARLAVRERIKPLFPLVCIDQLPPSEWAQSLAAWIKTSGLGDVWEAKDRVELLVACFDEFFTVAYASINADYSVRRASFGVALLYLDLYHALLDVEELQDALSETFCRGLSSNLATGTLSFQKWPVFDFCAAAALLIPTRPVWLVGEVFRRANHFIIDEVPAPLDRVADLYTRMQKLLDKLRDSRNFLARSESLMPLLKSIHAPYIPQKSLANLQTLYRQCRTRLSFTDQYEKTLTAIEDLNKAASSEDAQRKSAEETFFSDRLLLFSSPTPLRLQSIQSIIANFSMQVQAANGPKKIKFSSSHENWYLWIIQLSNVERKQSALNSLRNYPPNGDIQILSQWKQTHSWCRGREAKEEQQRWNRSSFDLHLHFEHHRQVVKRLKQEVKQPS